MITVLSHISGTYCNFITLIEFISVLPKFEVKLNPPSLATVNDDFPVGISAKYTFGKGVQGTATVLAEYPYYSSDSAKRQRPPIEKEINVSGIVGLKISFKNGSGVQP